MTAFLPAVNNQGSSHIGLLNSMVGQPAGALGLVTLTAVASATSLRVSLLVGAAALAIAAPLYLVARGAASAPSMPDVQDGVYARPAPG